MVENDRIKEILCYGDSNTWGCIPRWQDSKEPSLRYDKVTRWPMVMQSLLGDGYHIIEEGLCGRTSVFDRPNEPFKNGETCLKAAILTHRPLDLVIMMLGTNDLFTDTQPDKEHLGDGISRLCDIIQNTPKSGYGAKPPMIMLIPPTRIIRAQGRISVYPKFGCDKGGDLSKAFPAVYSKVAKEKGTYFLDNSAYAEPSLADGVHWTPDSHVLTGRAAAEKVKEIFGDISEADNG